MPDPTPGSPSPLGVQTTTSVQNPLTLVMTAKSATDSEALQALLHKLQSAPPPAQPGLDRVDKAQHRALCTVRVSRREHEACRDHDL